ncbi:tol-pal system YbgF family protein [Roseomonas populi]|uniref:TolA-binding protein n=1 Tax=Roseomonas populi TaxID=3121582 RepID=A0ABT1X2A1_9PROT|nr:tetratricopeptide repeat protein [Roseomonas pecuniae]MCR0982221.1 hypothetical protein [Roseomonas pecuniae]
MLRTRCVLRAGVLMAGVVLAGLVPAGRALAQAESREGIYLQNQILQLRQELEMVRRSGGGGGYPQPQLPPPGRGGAPAAGGEIVGQLLGRVGDLEEEVRRQRGRAEQAEYQNRTLQERIEKLQGDMEYRFNALEGRGGGAPAGGAPPAGRPAGGQQQGALTPPGDVPAPPPGQPAAPAPRTPEIALREGQAAIGRRDYATAEAAAREVLASRSTTRGQDAGVLLGDALLGKRDFQGAALAYDDAYRRSRSSGRAPDALIGLANAFVGFNAKVEACQTLDNLRTGFPRLAGAQADRAAQARQRAGCR